MPEIEALCYRCGQVWTRKRADGKPVCLSCYLRDAIANRGIQPDYHYLTPVGRGSESIPQSEVTAEIKKQADRAKKSRLGRLGRGGSS